MKKAIFIFLLNTFLMFNCAPAFPTVRQVINFDIGDMFHYRVVTGISGPYLHQTYYIESQELISKQYNLDSTNVTYQFKRISYQVYIARLLTSEKLSYQKISVMR